jgi:hypothetical protein
VIDKALPEIKASETALGRPISTIEDMHEDISGIPMHDNSGYFAHQRNNVTQDLVAVSSCLQFLQISPKPGHKKQARF